MNWLTKAFKKVFSDELQDKEDYIDENEIPTYKQSKIPFRFPLLSDVEKDRFINGEELKDEQEEEPQPLYMHKQWQKQRQNTIVHQSTKSSTEQFVKPIKTDSEQEVKPRITKVPVQSKIFTPTDVPSPVHGFNQRKLTPIKELLVRKNQDEVVATTNVVSPKPNTVVSRTVVLQEQEVAVSQVMDSPQEQEVAVTQEMVSPPDQEVTVTQEMVSPQEQEVAVTQEMVSPPEQEVAVTQVMDSPQEQEVAVSQEMVSPPEQEVTVTQVMDSPPGQEIAATTVIPLPKPSVIVTDKPALVIDQVDTQEIRNISDVIEMPLNSSQSSDEENRLSSVQAEDRIVTEKKKKSLPFNVLMLNSDKEKYQQKKVQVPTFKKDNPSKSIESPHYQPTPVAPPTVQSAEVVQEKVEEIEGYVFPNENYLVPPEQKTQDYDWMQMQADRLIESLSYFQVKAEIVQMVQGPAVTQFEITVGQGTKVSKIRNLADDLKLALAAKDIRIQAPIPGKSSIGIEIPNRVSRPVRISEVVGSSTFTESDSPLEAALGLDLTGKPVTIDLRKMPHGLIAGATGSGKSVCINSILVSLLYKATPKELNLLLIDPKMVELAPFNHIPHLVSPVITDVKAATAALKWAVEEMERRYQLFAHTGVRDITRYNTMADEKRQFAQKLPYLLIVIDELADLMMMAPTEVEESICRIAQKARACGIHLVVATQRPSVDVITGLIKANIPTRIAFSVSSQIDSRTILDVQGAERLLGRGDMLYLGNGMSAPTRLQGTYVTDEEMEKIIDHARSQGEPSYLFEQEELVRRLEVAEDQDELFEEACRFILEQGSASTSLLQRKYHIGYNRAARLVDLMEQHGYVSEQRGSKAREVFITENDLILLFGE
ncbi:DNA translocase FtsK [Paenisporosarcina indica]|uniref:DNA translocase FtsK n=1 Tax=Paenisporosarcina indica TaxID=650093 RepID=UPI00094FF7C2|nr:DNA translocase FtsK [Paenisporosarcina indica]